MNNRFRLYFSRLPPTRFVFIFFIFLSFFFCFSNPSSSTMSIPRFVKKDKGNPPNARSLREVQIRGGLVPPGKSFSRFLLLFLCVFRASVGCDCSDAMCARCDEFWLVAWALFPTLIDSIIDQFHQRMVAIYNINRRLPGHDWLPN